MTGNPCRSSFILTPWDADRFLVGHSSLSLGLKLSQSDMPNPLRRVDPRCPSVSQGQAESLKSVLLSEYFMPKAAKTDLADAAAADMPATYEAALSELETLVAQLESGQMPLDQLLTGYQRGAVLLAFCRDKLKAVEDQIQVLDGGQLKPWSGA